LSGQNRLASTLLSGQQNLANSFLPTSEYLAGRIGEESGRRLNFDTPFSETLNTAPQLLSDKVSDAVFAKSKSFLDPQWGQNEQELENQLSRQGIPIGSEAYNNAMEQLANSRTQAYDAAGNEAIARGISGAQGLFGLAQAGQKQNLDQQTMAQQQPFMMLSQLLGATPVAQQTPGQPIATPGQIGIAPTDITGSTAAANAAANQQYQSQVAQDNATTGGVAGLAGTLAMGAMMY
jgi:hypothetical protein